MIELDAADVFYGAAQALFGVSVTARPGEVVALLGRNGAGKSTTLRTMAGWHGMRGGTIRLSGETLDQPTAEDMSLRGVALVPEDRQVFPTLTVEENLRMALVTHKPARWTLEGIYDFFPRLGERRSAYGAALSGGEQQMLAIARALLCQPETLLLDEPTEGLSPVLAEAVVEAIRSIAAERMAIVIVEQNARIPLKLAHRFYVLDSGRVAWSGGRAAFARDEAQVNRLLSL